MILGARTWTAYMLVADGYWRSARLTDFFSTVPSVEGSAVVLGLAGPRESVPAA